DRVRVEETDQAFGVLLVPRAGLGVHNRLDRLVRLAFFDHECLSLLLLLALLPHAIRAARRLDPALAMPGRLRLSRPPERCPAAGGRRERARATRRARRPRCLPSPRTSSARLR